jgi:hypothetical protein
MDPHVVSPMASLYNFRLLFETGFAVKRFQGCHAGVLIIFLTIKEEGVNFNTLLKYTFSISTHSR